MKGMFLTERHRKLLGLKEEGPQAKDGRCCEHATMKQCTCDASGWVCKVHNRSVRCIPGNTHD